MDEKIRLKIARRITLLYLIEIEDRENLPFVDPLNYREDVKALIKRGFLEESDQGKLDLAPKGRKLMKSISLQQKWRYRRYFFSH